MSANSKIEWTDHTFNPWIGCTKVSPGCLNCYAETRSKRTDGVVWGKGRPRKRTSAANWKQPLKWNRSVVEAGVTTRIGSNGTAGETPASTPRRTRVFCASLADWLDDEVPIEWLADLLALIHATPNLDWLLLTKRPENFYRRVEAVWADNPRSVLGGWLHDWIFTPGHDPENVWIGTSVEDQKRAEERIRKLLEIPARIRFLSCEPLLGPLDLRFQVRPSANDGRPLWPCSEAAVFGIDWVIIGGESGPNAREFNVRWPLQIVAQCQARRVPVFVKQLGALVVDRNDAGFDGENGREWPMDTETRDIDSGYQGAPVRVLLRNRKGGDPAEWPEDLRIREFPESAINASPARTNLQSAMPAASA